MIQIWHSIALIFVGWLLGLLGPTVIEAIRKRYQRHDIAKAILTELSGILYPLATTVYLVKQRAGLVDKELLEWLLSICENYQGMYADDRVPQSIDSQLKLDNNQLKALNEKTKGDGTKALTLRKINTPFIDLNINII